MLIILTFLLATAIQPTPINAVRLDRNGWVVETPKPDRGLQPNESLWQWSEHCAPQKLTAGDEPRCASVRAVRVDVVDSKERPIPKAIVQWATEAMLADLPDSRLPAVATLENGSASIEVPTNEPVWVRVCGTDRATHWRRIDTQSLAVEIKALPPATTLIRVVGEDGKPVERARIALIPTSCTTICPERLMQFDLPGKPLRFVAPAGTPYRLVAWSDSHAPLTRTIAIGSPGDMQIALPAGGSIAARIVDGKRKPIAGAGFSVVFRLPSLHEATNRSATVGDDGRVTIAGLPKASVQWTATAAGFGRRIGASMLGAAGVDLDDVLLSPARSARIVVLDSSEQPLFGARVVARDAAAGTTDHDGVVRFKELPTSDVDLQIEADGFLPAKAELRESQSEAKIIMDQGVAIRATLVREIDGRPPESVRARITNNGAESVRTVAIQKDCSISGLRPGSARVRITAEGAEPFDSGTLALRAGEIADLGTVMLKSGAVLRGTLVDETRSPVEGARVRLLRTDGDSPSLAQVLGSWEETTSAADGSFQLSGLSGGAQLVVVEAKGYAERALPNVSIDSQEASLDLGTIVLTPGREVHLTCHPLSRCSLGASLLLAGPDFPFLALHADLRQGEGTFYRVPSGNIALRLERSRQIVHETTIAVHAGTEPEDIDVALPSSKVQGTVTVGGDPARGGSLLFTRSVRGAGIPIMIQSRTEQGSSLGSDWIGAFGASTAGEVDSSGRFEIDDIEPADYDVVFRNDGGATAPVPITIADVEVQTLPLRFEDGQIAGIVLTADQRPTSARIEITDGMGATLSTTSGLDGRFQLLGVSQGRATIRASASGHQGEQEVDVGRQSARNVVLRLSEEESDGLTIKVLDATGRGAAGVLAFVMTPHGMAMASTDQNGKAIVRSGGKSSVALPFAVYRPGGAWAFGTVGTSAPGAASLPPRSGSLLIRSPIAGVAAISTPNGFPLDQVLPMVGITPQIVQGGSLQIAGLSPGTYTVAMGALQRIVSIDPDKAAVVDMSLAMNGR